MSRESEGSACEKKGAMRGVEHGESEETEGKKYEGRKVSVVRRRCRSTTARFQCGSNQRRVRIWQATSNNQP